MQECYSTDLADAEWKVIEPYVPAPITNYCANAERLPVILATRRVENLNGALHRARIRNATYSECAEFPEGGALEQNNRR